jgi:hypothetical protein
MLAQHDLHLHPSLHHRHHHLRLPLWLLHCLLLSRQLVMQTQQQQPHSDWLLLQAYEVTLELPLCTAAAAAAAVLQVHRLQLALAALLLPPPLQSLAAAAAACQPQASSVLVRLRRCCVSRSLSRLSSQWLAQHRTHLSRSEWECWESCLQMSAYAEQQLVQQQQQQQQRCHQRCWCMALLLLLLLLG